MASFILRVASTLSLSLAACLGDDGKHSHLDVHTKFTEYRRCRVLPFVSLLGSINAQYHTYIDEQMIYYY